MCPANILRTPRMTMRNDRRAITITAVRILVRSSFPISSADIEYRVDRGEILNEFTSKKPETAIFIIFPPRIYSPPASARESVHQTEPTKRQISRGKDDTAHIQSMIFQRTVDGMGRVAPLFYFLLIFLNIYTRRSLTKLRR